jgi:hypothetical protein
LPSCRKLIFKFLIFCFAGRRKSAVELLQETKAFYVKSESVLDSKQEFKNAEHLHVTNRSPTMDHNPNHHAIHYHWERGGPPPSAPPALSPYATFSYGCGLPPYYHYHDQLNLDHLHLMQANYLNSINSIKREKHHHHKREKNISSHNTHTSSAHHNHASHTNQAPKVTAKITLIDGTNEDSWREYEKLERKSKSKSSSKRAAEAAALAAVAMQQHPLPPIPHQLLAKEVASNSSGSGSAKSHSHAKNMGVGKEIPHGAHQGPITFTSFSQNGSLYSSLEKRISANLPVISSKTGGVATINQGTYLNLLI